MLAGTAHKVQIFSDHKNLQYWKSPQHINWWIAREVLELSEYNYKIHHVKGKENAQADTLSQRPDYPQGEEDNSRVTVLLERLFVRTTNVQLVPTTITEVSMAEMSLPDPVYTQNAQTLNVTDGQLRTSSYLHGLPLGPFPFLSTTFHSHAYCTITCLVP